MLHGRQAAETARAVERSLDRVLAPRWLVFRDLSTTTAPYEQVVTTPLTFCATANSIIHAGGRPVFADVNPRTMNLDPAAADARPRSSGNSCRSPRRRVRRAAVPHLQRRAERAARRPQLHRHGRGSEGLRAGRARDRAGQEGGARGLGRRRAAGRVAARDGASGAGARGATAPDRANVPSAEAPRTSRCVTAACTATSTGRASTRRPRSGRSRTSARVRASAVAVCSAPSSSATTPSNGARTRPSLIDLVSMSARACAVSAASRRNAAASGVGREVKGMKAAVSAGAAFIPKPPHSPTRHLNQR